MMNGPLPTLPVRNYHKSGQQLDDAVSKIRDEQLPYSSDINLAVGLWIEMRRVEKCAIVLRQTFEEDVFEISLLYNIGNQSHEYRIDGKSDTFPGAICAAYVELEKGRGNMKGTRTPISRPQSVIGVTQHDGQMMQFYGDGAQPVNVAAYDSAEYERGGGVPVEGEEAA
jgi:hypothetical protein